MYSPTADPNSTVDANSTGGHGRPTSINASDRQNSPQETAPTRRASSRSTTKPAVRAMNVAATASTPNAIDTNSGLKPSSHPVRHPG